MKSETLLFIHGFPFNSSMWDFQIEHFHGQYNTLAPDLRGHRDGPKGPGPWMIAHHVEDLKKLLQEKGIEKAHLIGCSMGGYIALHFVQQYPEKVASLVLCDTRADADSNDAKDKRFALIQRLHRDGLNAFAREFAQTVLGESTQKIKPSLLKKVEDMILSNTVEDVALSVGALASRRDSTEALAKINCPCLVIVGIEDKVTPVDVNQKLAQGLKKSEFKKIPKAGHLANFEQPAAFNEALQEFLKANIKPI